MNTFFLIALFGVSAVLCSPSGYGTGYGAGGGGGAGAGGYNQRISQGDGNQYNNRYQDGSYDFGYNTGAAFQSESRSSGGLVSGKYGSTNPDGTYVNVEYQGQSTGGDGGGRYSPEKAGASAAYRAPAFAPAAVRPAAVRPAAFTAPKAYQAYQAAPSQRVVQNRPQEYAQFNLERKPDGSYQYNYQSSDSSKTESRSGDGQVQGSYSYRGDDGVQRTVDYSAGQQGFLADGAHLPVTDDGQPAAGTNQGAGAASAALRTGGFQSQSYSSGRGYSGYQPATSQQYAARPQGTYKGGFQSSSSYDDGSYRSSSYTDGGNEAPKPFAFNYNAGDHSRQEQQDASGVVRGTYTVNTPDGNFKQLTYQADDSGFHVVDEKQVQSGGGSSAGSYVGGGAAQSQQTSGRLVHGGAQTYKQKSIQSPSYYR